MHEYGNHIGTVTFYAEPYDVDEEYEAYLATLTRDELEDEVLNIKAQLEVINNLKLDH